MVVVDPNRHLANIQRSLKSEGMMGDRKISEVRAESILETIRWRVSSRLQEDIRENLKRLSEIGTEIGFGEHYDIIHRGIWRGDLLRSIKVYPDMKTNSYKVKMNEYGLKIELGHKPNEEDLTHLREWLLSKVFKNQGNPDDPDFRDHFEKTYRRIVNALRTRGMRPMAFIRPIMYSKRRLTDHFNNALVEFKNNPMHLEQLAFAHYLEVNSDGSKYRQNQS